MMNAPWYAYVIALALLVPIVILWGAMGWHLLTLFFSWIFAPESIGPRVHKINKVNVKG